jgi:hypothetical protein
MSRRLYYNILLYGLLLITTYRLFGFFTLFSSPWMKWSELILLAFALIYELSISARWIFATGVIAIITVLVGILFRIQYWPFATILLLSGFSSLVILMFACAIRSAEHKGITMVIFVWILLFYIELIAPLFHWATGFLWIIRTLLLPFISVALGIQLAYGRKKSQEE